MARTPQTEGMRDAATAGLTSSGMVVDDLTVNVAGRRRVIRVFVARDLAVLEDDDETTPVEPLTLDEVAEATSTLSQVFDELSPEVIGEQPYTLEVSSVGVGTPLTRPEHFRRNVGRLVQVSRSGGPEQTSRLVAAGSRGVRLEATGDQWLTYEEISRAMVQVEFNRARTGDQS